MIVLQTIQPCVRHAVFSFHFNKRIVDRIVPFEIHLQITGNRHFVGLVPPCLLVTSIVLGVDSGGFTKANIANVCVCVCVCVCVYFPGDSRDWNVKIRLHL